MRQKRKSRKKELGNSCIHHAAFHFAKNISAGMCHINGPTIHDEAHVPFGGNGESGFGREGTDADMEAMTELKWVTVQL